MPESAVKGREDLWGADFPDDFHESAPVILLREQAEVLTSRTGGRVEGVVVKLAERGTAWASLYAKVPSLQGYMYKLLTVAHPVTANPDNPSPLSVTSTFGDDDFIEISGMDALRDWLRAVLSSEEAHSVIVNLLRYSTDRVAS